MAHVLAETISQWKIHGLPPRIEEYLDERKKLRPVRLTKLGQHLTFASGPFAEKMDEDSLYHEFLQYNPEISPLEARKLVDDKITTTGIHTRYYSPPLSETRTFADVENETAIIGALLMDSVLREHGIDEPDFFHLGTSTMRDDFSFAILNKLANFNGRPFDKNILCFNPRAACASWVIGFINALTHPDLKNKRGVIGAVEPIGYLRHQRHFKDQLAIATTFGDYHSMVALDTSKFEPITWQIRVVPDGGVIKVKRAYAFSGEKDESVENQLHLTYAAGGRDITQATKCGVLLDIAQPDEDITVIMNNKDTANHFLENTVQVMVEELIKFHCMVPDGQLSWIVIHDPSRFVSQNIGYSFYNTLKNYPGLEKSFVQGVPQFSFKLHEMGASNSSSATTPNKFQYLVESREIKRHTDKYCMLVAPGIGSAIAAIIFKFV